MPGTAWKRSLNKPALYEKLRAKGYTKEEAARISNSIAKKQRAKKALKNSSKKKS